MEAFWFAIGTIVPLLLILVVVHEFGHYITARMFGVKVLEFGVSFPPRLFAIYTGKTKVILHEKTNFIGVDDWSSLKPGQIVEVGSIYDAEWDGLVAFEIRYPKKTKNEDHPRHYNRDVDHVLWHQGKIKSIDENTLVIADMAYSVNLIPLGGFVKLSGESNHTVPYSLGAIDPWKRIVVMASGAFMNAILPIVILTIIFMIPKEVQVGTVVINSVGIDTPAEKAGLQPGMRIIEINNEKIETPAQITKEINLKGKSNIDVIVEQNGATQTLQVAPKYNSDYDRWMVGIGIDLIDTRTESRSDPIWDAVPNSFDGMWKTAVLFKNAVDGMIEENSLPEVAGPIGIAQITGEVSRAGGFVAWLSIGVLISINLAIINILPFPMLDGGRIVFVVLEWVRGGKRISHEKENMVHLLGLVILVVLIVVVSANDITKILS